ncbi:VPLPA-CTERM sorting domain-containing protein [uncultured Roseobacter sp.]|uniref:VPLPA-CTERM sorting domain-containing protein n=1 Tax=uncultured Roseobacter sp. TaxID=114847 RepID=UPI00260D6C63|nr:VPLPA-CTERM sorting domain-containing protein [uncultured Roseobacter sp.]
MKSILAAFAVALTCGYASAATISVYTDRALFEAALTGEVETEDFSGPDADVPFGASSATVGKLTISADSNGAGVYNRIDTPPIFPEVDGNGTTALNIFTFDGANASIAFEDPVFAFGADFYNFNDDFLRTQIGVLGELIDPPATDDNTLTFFGFLSDTAFDQVDFLALANDVFGVDNVTTATSPSLSAVPLPASFPMLILGLGGLLLIQRRRF